MEYPVNATEDLSSVVVALGAADEDFLRESLRVEQQALRSCGAEAVFNAYQLTAPLSCRQLGLPVASLMNWPDHPDFGGAGFEPRKRLDAAVTGINACLAESELPMVSHPGELYFRLSTLAIVPTFPLIDSYCGRIPNAHYVGHLGADRLECGPGPAWLESWQGTAGPHVVVYMGNGPISPELTVEVCVDAFGREDIQVAVAIGRSDQAVPSKPSSANVRLASLLPLRRLLAESELLIFHGGYVTLGTMMMSGRPGVAFPGDDTERGFYSERLVELGIGVRCGKEDFSSQGLRRVARRVLGGSYSRRAEEVRQSLPTLGGGERVVGLLEEEILKPVSL